MKANVYNVVADEPRLKIGIGPQEHFVKLILTNTKLDSKNPARLPAIGPRNENKSGNHLI